MSGKKERIVSAICTACLIIFFIGIVCNWIYSHFFNDYEQYYGVQKLNWVEEYPYKEVDNEIIGMSFVNSCKAKIVSIENSIESVVNTYTVMREPLSEIYCGIEKKLGISKIYGADSPVFVLENGNFSFGNESRADNKVIGEKLGDFNEYLQGEGVDFLYVMAPYKDSGATDNKYRGYIDYIGSNAEGLAREIRENNINFLNLRDEAARQNIDVNSLLFKTDHHWKPSGTLWGVREIALELNKNFGFDIDADCYDINNFNREVYKDFFGSQGKKATLAYAQPEDFEILTPKYNTDYHVSIMDYDMDITGSFEETLIDKKALRKRNYPEKYYESNYYLAYCYGEMAYVKIHNLNIKDDKKVLMIRDSFGNTGAPFLSLGLSELSVIDLRHFHGSIKAYIEEYKPDVVVMLVSGSSQYDTDSPMYNLR